MKMKLFKSKQGTSEKIVDFVDRIRCISNELLAAGENVCDDEIILTIVQGVLPIFENVVQGLLMNKGKNDLVVEDFVNFLKQEEERRSEKLNEIVNEEEMVSGKVFSVKSSPQEFHKNSEKILRCFNCNKIGHFANKCKLPRIKDVKCFNCNEHGHYASDCTKPNRRRKEETANMALSKNMEFALQTNISKNSKNCWILDSGASNHICNKMEMFKSSSYFDSFVIVANGKKLKTKAVGTIELDVELEDHKMVKLMMHDVLYVPDMEFNLISIAKLTEKGVLVWFDTNSCRLVLKENFSINCMRTENNLYVLKNAYTSQALASVSDLKDWTL